MRVNLPSGFVCLLMREQILVHSTEICLCSSRFSGGCGGARMWMDCLERKMAKHETEPVRILTLKLVNTVARHTSVRACVVAVLHERDRGIDRTLDVVIRSDRCRQPRVKWECAAGKSRPSFDPDRR